MKFLSKKRLINFSLGLLLGFLFFVLYNTYNRATSVPLPVDKNLAAQVENNVYDKIILAGGCFWCTESEYNHTQGVLSAVSGFTDVKATYKEGTGPSYQDVSSEKVKAREAVEVIYDPGLITIPKILELYFRHINPTDGGGQFADRGYHYSPAIYYLTNEQRDASLTLIKRMDATNKFNKKVAVEVLPFTNFYPAEEYHQDYKDKNAVRYNLYKEGSGRSGYVRDVWEDTRPYVQEIFGTLKTLSTTNKPQQKTMTTNISTGTSASWKNFSPAMKVEKLKTLTPLQFNVTQKDGTERSFQNEYDRNKEKGIYVDIVSGEPLFLSQDKYDSGTGWPSFVKPITEDMVVLKKEDGLFSSRVEVRSKIADSHLGHVFDDGPDDRGGKRYCMNSAALRFIPVTDMSKEGYGEYVGQVK